MTAGPARVSGARGLVPVGLGLVAGLAIAVAPWLPPVALVAVGLVVLGLSSPVALVGLMFLALLFDQVGLAGVRVANLPVTASKLAVLGSLGLWLTHSGFNRRRLLRWHPVLSALSLMVAVMGLSIAHAGSMSTGIYDFAGVGMLTVLVALVYTILAEERLNGLYRFVALTLVAVLALDVALGGSADGRSSGTMGDPNEWGSMVLLLTPFALGGMVHDRWRWAAPLRLALICLAPAAIMLSMSRAALLVGIVVGPLCLLMMRSRRGELVLSALAAAVVVPLLVDIDAALARFWRLRDALTGGGVAIDSSLDERAELGRQGIELFLEHWFIGVGPGNFGVATGFLPLEGGPRPAHNTYLQVAGEQGVLGLAALVICGIIVLRTLWQTWTTAVTPATRSRVAGVTVGLLGVAMMAATLGLLTMSMAYLVLGVGLAMWWHEQVRVAQAAVEAARPERAPWELEADAT